MDVFCFCCAVRGHRSTDCSVSACGGSKCKVVAISGRGVVHEEPVAVVGAMGEVVEVDRQQSLFTTH